MCLSNPSADSTTTAADAGPCKVQSQLPQMRRAQRRLACNKIKGAGPEVGQKGEDTVRLGAVIWGMRVAGRRVGAGGGFSSALVDEHFLMSWCRQCYGGSGGLIALLERRGSPCSGW